jgi:putative DNA primase/helicase
VDSHVTTDEPTTGGAHDDSERSRAYLTEKNRLLTDRVDELEATLERKNERIDTLEAEIERLTEELAGRDRESGDPQEARTVDPEGDNGSETASVWGRTKRLLGSSSE